MTEGEWMACTDPAKMLMFLQSRGKISHRKLRLFGVACCRRIWHLLPKGPDDFNYYAVELAERFADGLASRQELDDAVPLFTRFALRNEPLEGERAFLTWNVISADAFRAAAMAAFYAGEAAALAQEAMAAERAAQAVLLRDIFGDLPPQLKTAGIRGRLHALFRPLFRAAGRPMILDSRWLTPNVVNLAQAIYDAGEFDRLPSLVDALEEGRCTNSGVVAHCHRPGQHVRCCWVVDLVLGKS